MNNRQTYLAWLEKAKRSDKDREKKWRLLAPPISQTRWLWIQTIHEGLTWDVAVECSDNLPDGAADVIMDLNYYGKAVGETDYYRLHHGIPWDKSGFIITCRGVDGSDEHRFKTRETAMEYVMARAQWWTGPNSAHSDYAHYDLHGFGYTNWRKHQA